MKTGERPAMYGRLKQYSQEKWMARQAKALALTGTVCSASAATLSQRVEVYRMDAVMSAYLQLTALGLTAFGRSRPALSAAGASKTRHDRAKHIMTAVADRNSRSSEKKLGESHD